MNAQIFFHVPPGVTPIKRHNNTVVVTGQGGQHAAVLAGGGPRPRHPHQQEGDQGGRGDALRPDGAHG